jgi:hypothetical protein
VVLPRGLLFVQAIQADASGYRNGDSDRAERQAGFVAAFFFPYSLAVVWSTASLVSSTTAD